MKTARIIMALAIMFSGLMAATSFAAKEAKDDTGKSTGVQTPSADQKVKYDVIRATRVTGADIKDTKGDKLGDIEDMVISKDGRIQYVVLAHGGVLGAGEKLYAIPWKALRTTNEEDTFTVNMDRDKLAKAPSFEKGNWPNFADREVSTMYYGYYGVEPERSMEKTGSEGSFQQNKGMETSPGMQQGSQGMTGKEKGTTDMNK